MRADTYFSHPSVRQVMALMIPGAFGASVYQINILITQILVSFLPRGSVSYLWYADRFFELPLGLFAVSVATAALPILSRKAARRDAEGFLRALSYSLRLTFFVCVPATLGLILLREPLLRVFFQRGAFDHEATLLTARALYCYALGLPVVAGGRVFVQAYYAHKDTRTPVYVAIVSFLSNFLFGVFLMRGPLKHAGLALATSLSAYINFFLLLFVFSQRVKGLPFKEILVSLTKTSVATVLMGAVVMLVFRGSPGGDALRLIFAVSAGAAAFLAGVSLLKSEELRTIWTTALLRRR